jgi:hypothetical protein
MGNPDQRQEQTISGALQLSQFTLQRYALVMQCR